MSLSLYTATLILMLTNHSLGAGGKGHMRELGLPSTKNTASTVRISKGQEILKYMNTSVDPCTDFYEFACGKWVEFHTVEKEGELNTTQKELELLINKDLQIILEGESRGQGAASERKVKDFYNSCLKAESPSEQQSKFFLNFVKTYGGIPAVEGTSAHVQYNWLQVIGYLRANIGLEVLIGVDIDTNLQTMRGNSIYLTEPKTSLLPVEQCNALVAKETNISDENYKEILMQISQNMQQWFSLQEQDADHFANEIIRFELELCKEMRKEEPMRDEQEENEVEPVLGALQRGGGRAEMSFRKGQSRLHGNRHNAGQFARQSLQQFTQQFGNLIDFKKFVDLVFESSINDQVYMRSEAYYRNLARVLRRTPKPTMINYVMYRAVSFFDLPIVNENDRFERNKFCVNSVLRYFPKIIGEMYHRRNQRGEVRSDVEYIFDIIKKTFEDSLKANWIDENARRTAKQKLAPFKIGFPVYQNLDLSDLQTDRLDMYWRKLEIVLKYIAKQDLNRLYSTDLSTFVDSVEAPEVRMKINPLASEIISSWGLLQPPLYDYFYPKAIKFSLLGQLMARELVKAFDEQGWAQNPLSPMHRDEYTAGGFRNTSECFRTQFSNYLHNSPDVFQNNTKLRDLIAENSGLNIAFNAYLAWLETMDANSRAALTKETLSDVNYTNTQLFFIHFAQSHCAATYDTEQKYFPLDLHTMERYDVNGPLGNNIEFAREFGCTPGSEMNPDDKCILY